MDRDTERPSELAWLWLLFLLLAERVCTGRRPLRETDRKVPENRAEAERKVTGNDTCHSSGEVGGSRHCVCVWPSNFSLEAHVLVAALVICRKMDTRERRGRRHGGDMGS